MKSEIIPRNIIEIKKQVLTLATSSMDICEGCFYVLFSSDGKIYLGASVRLAELLVSEYGNISVETKGYFKDIFAVSTCKVVDLERNVSTTETYHIESPKHEKTILQACNSMAYRNCVSRAIPKIIVDDVLNKIIQFALTGKNKKKRISELVSHFVALGVSEKLLLKTLNKKKKSELNDDDLIKLIGFKTAIKSGEGSTKDLFPDSKINDLNKLLK